MITFDISEANSEINAMESYINMNDFLGIATEGFSFDWNRFKMSVINFFKNLWKTITNFFSQFFVKHETMLNRYGIDTMMLASEGLINDLNVLADYILTCSKLGTDLATSTHVTEQCDAIVKKCEKELTVKCAEVMAAHSDMKDYKIYKQGDVNAMHNVTRNVQNKTDEILKNAGDDPGEQARLNNYIIQLTTTLEYVDTAIAKVMVAAQVNNRKSSGDITLDEPIALKIVR